ncbi:inositol monophosphatase family protein [Bacteriovorax sp. DB6_IX]|uniref:inositol monophosphatase family protein n=1 Tax=Bacteriovorax sp. DB6_IX TaxID=1353530 RepID=UPI00038A4C2B|nr:inositol monophosphatase family protein [Bacteriovorax sp. DB6_IX]EQC49732.1 inositol monophosphatase family protein [Bacteriovorax sp. DB6_IX]
MYRLELEQLKMSIYEKLHEISERELKVDIKKDKSFVTEFDLFVSDKVKEIFTKRHPDFHFYSEEDPESFDFPAIVLDPIDGTREFVKGYGECAVSLAILYSADVDNPKNFGWIYNPFSGFEISNNLHVPVEQRTHVPPTINIMVSRTEWEKNLINHELSRDTVVIPMGSIAYKLGLLAAGACDVVVSKRDKNIWDIAAGIIICHARGIKSYSNGELITRLDKKRYDHDFIWGKEREVQIVKDLI